MISRRQLLAAAALTALTGGAATAAVASSDDNDAPPAEPVTGTPPGSELAQVGRGDLTQTKEFNATIGFGDAVELPIAASGVVTARPEAGTIIEPGQELIRLDNKPVFLAAGNLPMYRTLQKTPEVRVKGQKYTLGFDVGQLKKFLVEAGFDDDGKVDFTDLNFDPATERAVKAWQKAVGLEITGRVDRTQMIVMPGSVRIDTTAQLGADFSSLTATASEQIVSFNVSNRDRRLVAIGSDLAIEAGSVSTTGTVRKIERVDDGQGGSTNRVTMSIAELLPVDVGAPQVVAVEQLATDVMTVPVRALLAVSEGGFAVELPAVGGTKLVRVEVGEVANGLAEISGSVQPGDDVVVPA